MGRRSNSVLAMRVSITTAVSGLLHHSRTTNDAMHGISGVSKFSTTNMPAIHVQVKSSSDDIRIVDIKPSSSERPPPPSSSPRPSSPSPMHPKFASESDASQSSGSSRASTDTDSDSQLDYPPMSTMSIDRKITVRDYATTTTSTGRTHTPIPEIFDQHLALAEYELRMREDPRVTPISGKTLHRLIELGCVTEAEASERWKRMDWNAYFAYKALGKPYPYRTMKNLSIPRKRKEREKIVKEKAQQILFCDKVREKAVRGEKAARMGSLSGVPASLSKLPQYDVEQNVLGRVPGLTRRKTMGTIPFYGDGEELSAFRDANRQRMNSLNVQSDGQQLVVPIGA